MKTELRPPRLNELAARWGEMAPSTPDDFRFGWESRSFERSREEIGPGMILAQSATKRAAVRFRRDWGPLRAAKTAVEPAPLQSQTRVTRMFALPTAGVARQIKTQPVIAEVFRGRVDDIIDGTAIVTLFSKAGEPITAQWPEQDLATESIEKGDLFELTMTDTGGTVSSSFRKVARKPIPDDLWREIERVKAAYSDLQADGVDGDEEG